MSRFCLASSISCWKFSTSYSNVNFCSILWFPSVLPPFLPLALSHTLGEISFFYSTPPCRKHFRLTVKSAQSKAGLSLLGQLRLSNRGHKYMLLRFLFRKQKTHSCQLPWICLAQGPILPILATGDTSHVHLVIDVGIQRLVNSRLTQVTLEAMSITWSPTGSPEVLWGLHHSSLNPSH
jgi:hypothetical protein